MGRSVNYARNYSAIAYKDIRWMGEATNWTCDNEECDAYGEESWDEEDGAVCSCCGSILEKNEFYDEFYAQIQWDDFIIDIQSTVKNEWPSFDKCNEYLENEVYAIARNDLAYITVSEYIGLASLCLVSRYEYDDDYLGDGYKKANMAKGFCNRIAPKFEKLFGELRLVGRFSNGEAVFEKISA